MSKSIAARRRHFASLKARKDQQNQNLRPGQRPVSYRTMQKIQPPAPKPKFVPEAAQVEISAGAVQIREESLERTEEQKQKMVQNAMSADSKRKVKKIATPAPAKKKSAPADKKPVKKMSKVVAKPAAKKKK